MYCMQPISKANTLSVLENHLQQGAQGVRMCETPLAYDGYHGKEWVNPFWRNLQIAIL